MPGDKNPCADLRITILRVQMVRDLPLLLYPASLRAHFLIAERGSAKANDFSFVVKGVKVNLGLGFFEEVGVFFQELVFEFLVKFGKIQSFGFGQEVDGDVGHAQQVGSL